MPPPDRSPKWLFELLRSVLSAVLAVAGACWTARGILGEYDKRLSILEVQHVGHWDAVNKRLDEIHEDVRELRHIEDTSRARTP